MPAAGQAHEPAGGGFDDAAVDYDGAARSFDEAARTIGEIRNVPVTACQVRLTHGGYDTQRTSQDPEVVFPVRTLLRLAETGAIGAVAASTMGYIPRALNILERVVPPVMASLVPAGRPGPAGARLTGLPAVGRTAAAGPGPRGHRHRLHHPGALDHPARPPLAGGVGGPSVRPDPWRCRRRRQPPGGRAGGAGRGRAGAPVGDHRGDPLPVAGRPAGPAAAQAGPLESARSATLTAPSESAWISGRRV